MNSNELISTVKNLYDRVDEIDKTIWEQVNEIREPDKEKARKCLLSIIDSAKQLLTEFN